MVAHDLHPDYLSTRYALEREGVETVGVQHHHAHLAACLAEHGETGPAVGAIYDGTGYGEDGTVWGGELLVGDLAGYERAGALAAVPMPGGERAVQEPWRMACSWLLAAGVAAAGALVECRRARSAGARWRRWRAPAWRRRSPRAWGGCSTPWARCAACARAVTYEGQAAVELEALATAAGPLGGGYPLPFDGRHARRARDDRRR